MSRRHLYATLATLALTCSLAACGKSEGNATATDTTNPAPSTTVVAGDPLVKAREIFAQRCTPCHGAEGRGDGAASAALTPQPRNFHDAEWQKSVTDEYLTQIVLVGGAAVGKSPAMPSNPDLRDEAVRLAIKDVLREFGKQP